VKIQTRTLGSQHILYDADALREAEPWLFDREELQNRGLLTGLARGRGTTWFYAHDELALVLRHYQRGGMIAQLLNDRYLWTGIKRTRAWREWALLAHMHARELPVPQPIAARVVRHGLWYRADLITRRILYTEPLADKLMLKGLDASRWRGIGLCIRRFHDAGVYHADLNAHNILLGKENAVFLADFDKGELRKPDERWKQENLARLHRSLRKLKDANKEFCFGEADWTLLVDAYRRLG
jgi:3-deoxy-D-manno-octulosonic acid kinase